MKSKKLITLVASAAIASGFAITLPTTIAHADTLHKTNNIQTINSTINYKIVNSKGSLLSSKSVTDRVGNTTPNSVSIPKGYKVSGITVGGKLVNEIPNRFKSDNQEVVIHVSSLQNKYNNIVTCINKNTGTSLAGVKLKITYNNGNTEEVISTESGVPMKSDSKIKSISVIGIPNRFKLDKSETKPVNIIENKEGNKTISTNANLVFQDTTKSTIKYEIKDLDNKVLGSGTATGTVGSKDSLPVPNMPKGYKLVKVTNNGNVVNGLPATFTKDSQTIIYTVQSTTGSVSGVIMYEGEPLGTFNKTDIPLGSEITSSVLPPNLLNNYTISKVELDGSSVGSKIDFKLSNPYTKLVVYVTKNKPSDTTKGGPTNSGDIPGGSTSKVTPNKEVGTLTLTMRDSTGKVWAKGGCSGTPGTSDTLVLPKVPTGYKIKDITINGVKVPGLPSVILGGTNHVVINIVKDASVPVTNPNKTSTITYTLVGPSGTILGKGSAEGLVGSKDTLTFPVNPYTWKLSYITMNGKRVSGLPSSFGDKDTDLVFHYVKADSTNSKTPSKVDSNTNHPSKVDSNTNHPSKIDNNTTHPSKVDSNTKTSSKPSTNPKTPSKPSTNPKTPSKINSNTKTPSKVDSDTNHQSKVDSNTKTPSKVDSNTKGDKVINPNVPNPMAGKGIQNQSNPAGNQPSNNGTNVETAGSSFVDGNPKTGDASELPYLLGLLGATSTFVLMRKNKVPKLSKKK